MTIKDNNKTIMAEV